MILARHDADWGRAAHEFGHNLVDGGLVLGEDVYSSDLVDGTQATAEQFELMGSHDSHPMFSGLFMQQLHYYSAANIHEVQWDRNPFSQDFDVVAHGASVDGAANRYNLVRIKVSPGLDYYVEVRQRPPGGSSQVYDTNIPIPSGSGRNGGVIVTKAITDELDNNQQTRLVTLLHDPDRAADRRRGHRSAAHPQGHRARRPGVHQPAGLPGAGGVGPGDRRHTGR